MKEKICEGIYRVEVPIPYDFKSINCYLIKGSHGYTIIDTGDYTNAAKEVWQQVIGNDKIERIVITHSHADHFGLSPWFQQEYGASIVMSTHAKEQFLFRKSLFMDKKFDNRMFTFLKEYGFSNEGDGDVFNRLEAYEFMPDEIFDPNGEVRIGDQYAKSILTPGHSKDHTCFYLEHNQCLFIGDHLLQEINPIVMPDYGMLNPLAHYLPSFHDLRQLLVKHTLPGHGSLIQDLNNRINRLLKHYEKRWSQILNLILIEEKSANEITGILYANAKVEYMNSALIQTITNLNYLESCQKVIKRKVGDLFYFKAISDNE